MADMHDLLVVGVPVFVILAGILFNNSNAKDLHAEMKEFRSEMKGDMKELRSEMKTGLSGLRLEMKTDLGDLRSEMNARFDLVDAELRYFHGTLGQHEARINAIEKRG